MKDEINEENAFPEETEEYEGEFEDDEAQRSTIDEIIKGRPDSGAPSVGKAEVVEDLGDPLSIYLNEVMKYKTLTADEEKAVAAKAREGDSDAVELLIKSNQRLIISMAWKYFRGRGLELEDIIAAGNEGLRAGIAKFDPERGVRLATFAGYDIKKYMRRAVYDEGSTIRLPEKMHIALRKLTAATEAFIREKGRKPTEDELAEITGLGRNNVRTLLFYQAAKYVPLDAPSGDDDDSPIGEHIAADEGGEGLSEETADEIMRRHFKVLDPREYRIVTAYYGLFGADKKKLADLADEYGLAKQRISQIRKSAEKKLFDSGLFEELK
ncbi:MAG: sigma-70 family RNA polymerase sigma factor [Clostridia bacterium]|nr:sigma-70 family RNA polymerase sigma factor [Clostridia bacterium]